MAKGRFASRVETGLGLFGMIALGVTLAIVFQWNPWPGIQSGVRNWLDDRGGVLSEPATAWVQRAAGQAEAAAVTDRAVLVLMGNLVEARARGDGALLWQKEINWAAFAGTPSAAVALVAKTGSKGFEAVDPYSGETRWSDREASGAWTFRDAVLVIRCVKDGCAIVNRAPADGAVRASIPIGGAPRAIGGANSGLLDLRDPDGSLDDARSASPRPLPRYLGFLVDRKVQVIDTTAGRRVREEQVPADVRAVVVGNRTVRISSTVREGGGCRYRVEARDAGAGQEAWRKEGYNLRTADGAGCEPRKEPMGGGTALVATRLDDRQVFLSAVDGRELAVAGPGETLLGTDGEYGLLRTADGQLRAVNLGKGGATAWTRAAPAKARVGLTAYAVVITDPAGERVTALDPATGQVKLDLKTGATVIGVNQDGVVLGRGRSIGWIAWGTVA